MRTAIVISTLGHMSMMLWGYVAFPDARQFEVTALESVPVEIVPIGELTKLAKGAPTAELREEPSTADPVKELITRPPPPTPPKVEEPAPDPEPSPLPEVAALPPAEAAPEPEPAPPLKAEPAPAAEQRPIPAPRARPKRPAKVVKTERKFASDKIAALLDKQDTAPQPDQSQKLASLGSRDGRPVTEMSQSEIDALRGQIQRCWNPPLGAIEAESLKVRLKLELTPDGRLAGRPEVMNSGTSPFFRAAADSARRAVQRCQPYDLPADKYETWRDVIVTFDPREMLGG